MTTATKPRDLLTALRIGLYHTTLAADRAHGLARWNDWDNKHGTAAEFRLSAAESDAAAEVLRATIAAAPDLATALRALADAVERYTNATPEDWPELAAARAALSALPA